MGSEKCKHDMCVCAAKPESDYCSVTARMRLIKILPRSNVIVGIRIAVNR